MIVVSGSVRTCVCMDVCMYLCVCMCVCMYVFMYTQGSPQEFFKG